MKSPDTAQMCPISQFDWRLVALQGKLCQGLSKPLDAVYKAVTAIITTSYTCGMRQGGCKYGIQSSCRR